MDRQKSFILMLAPLLLTACNENYSYTYYVQHPRELQKAITDCETASDKSSQQIAHCQVVVSAANTVITLSNAFQESPEKYGQRVLSSEESSATARAALDDAQAKYDELKKNNAPAADLAAAEDKLTNAQKDFDAKQNEVREMLAVIGIFSPE